MLSVDDQLYQALLDSEQEEHRDKNNAFYIFLDVSFEEVSKIASSNPSSIW